MWIHCFLDLSQGPWLKDREPVIPGNMDQLLLLVARSPCRFLEMIARYHPSCTLSWMHLCCLGCALWWSSRNLPQYARGKRWSVTSGSCRVVQTHSPGMSSNVPGNREVQNWQKNNSKTWQKMTKAHLVFCAGYAPTLGPLLLVAPSERSAWTDSKAKSSISDAWSRSKTVVDMAN